MTASRSARQSHARFLTRQLYCRKLLAITSWVMSLRGMGISEATKACQSHAPAQPLWRLMFSKRNYLRVGAGDLKARLICTNHRSLHSHLLLLGIHKPEAGAPTARKNPESCCTQEYPLQDAKRVTVPRWHAYRLGQGQEAVKPCLWCNAPRPRSASCKELILILPQRLS